MENAKQKAIELAYGIYWDKVKDFVDKNGWCNVRRKVNFQEIISELGWEAKIGNPYFWRPKSLSGIEHNFNWISINSEDDLPNENGEYWVVFNKEIIHAYFEVGNVRFSQNGRDFYRGLPSHYQTINKPNFPIY